jgi:hypothetical protein
MSNDWVTAEDLEGLVRPQRQMLTVKDQEIGWRLWLDLRTWVREQCTKPSPELLLKPGSTLWFDPSCPDAEVRILYRTADSDEYWLRGKIDPDLLYLRYGCDEDPFVRELLIMIDEGRGRIETRAQYPCSVEQAGHGMFVALTCLR